MPTCWQFKNSAINGRSPTMDFSDRADFPNQLEKPFRNNTVKLLRLVLDRLIKFAVVF
jgi:hypothetical protein